MGHKVFGWRGVLCLGASIVCAVSVKAQGWFRPAPKDGPIAYLTDLEGKWGKVESFLAKSDAALYRDAQGKIHLRDGARFVYGGDSVDNGPDGIRIVDMLVDLKERYPDRVVLIMGNRDLNKLLIPSEMSPAGQAAGQARFEKWLNFTYGKKGETLPPERVKALDTPANRLRAALRGAPKGFEYRQQELSKIEGRPVSDEQVVADFMQEMQPGGRHHRLLELGQLSYLPTTNGKNSLFVHGAVSDTSLGFVPGNPKRFPDAQAWVDELNRWYRTNIQNWSKHPADLKGLDPFLGYLGPLPGTYANDDSVVYGRYSDEPGNPVLPSKSVQDWLAERKIRWVFGGHTPQDHIPSVLRGERMSLVLGDNTYVDHGSVVELSPDGQSVRVKAEFTGDEAGALKSRLVEHRVGVRDDSPIGRRIAGTNLLVKARLADGRWLATEILPGFQVRREVLTDRDLRERRLERPEAAPTGTPSAAPCGVPLGQIFAPPVR